MAADGSAEYGRLEVFYRGGWGTVCDTDFIGDRSILNFKGSAVSVACRQLGYKKGVRMQALVCSCLGVLCINCGRHVTEDCRNAT